MIFQENLRTKQDYLNAAAYAKQSGEGKTALTARLCRMKTSVTRMDLKESSRAMRADRQHQEDYIPVQDPCCEMRRLGFTEEEIDELIGGLQQCSE